MANAYLIPEEEHSNLSGITRLLVINSTAVAAGYEVKGVMLRANKDSDGTTSNYASYLVGDWSDEYAKFDSGSRYYINPPSYHPDEALYPNRRQYYIKLTSTELGTIPTDYKNTKVKVDAL